MGDEFNGDKKSRLDRIEDLVEVLVNEHIQFHEEHRQLLKAQVLLTDAQRQTEERLAFMAAAQQAADERMRAAQKAADERMAALIVTVDDLIRRPPQHN